LAHALGKGDVTSQLARDYAKFVAGAADIKDVDTKTSLVHVKRILHVASYIPLSPPADTTGPSRQMDNATMMMMLFTRDRGYGWHQGYDLIVEIRTVSRTPSASPLRHSAWTSKVH
jgi:hypothetical protein